jgi:hypothetical protein
MDDGLVQAIRLNPGCVVINEGAIEESNLLRIDEDVAVVHEYKDFLL